jgi:hypothetical protein
MFRLGGQDSEVIGLSPSPILLGSSDGSGSHAVGSFLLRQVEMFHPNELHSILYFLLCMSMYRINSTGIDGY